MGLIRRSKKIIQKGIEETLFKLIEKHSFREIKVSDLCEYSMVGRSSFYRYYKTLEEVLSSCIIRNWDEWCINNKIKNRKEITIDNIESFFHFCYSIKDKLNIIYNNKLDIPLFFSFERIINNDKIEDYYTSFYSYGLFGILKDWWRNNFKESPKDLTLIVKNIHSKRLLGIGEHHV